MEIVESASIEFLFDTFQIRSQIYLTPLSLIESPLFSIPSAWK